MNKERSDLGFGGELESLDLSAWTPKKPKVSNDRLAHAESKRVAEASGFRSREPAPPPPDPIKVEQRRRRTGRNAQFNLKARPETIEAFTAIADLQGWGLGETLEKAVALLEKEYATGRAGA